MGQLSESHALGGGLKSRHVTMLSIAGVIGASLFVVPAWRLRRPALRYCWPICSQDF